MNKLERIQATICGEKTDQVPYAFWTHLPGIDLDPEKLAETTYDFYRAYDLDFIKTMNNGMYGVECFGCEIDYSDIEKGGVAKIISTPICSSSDWTKLSPLSLNNSVLARELHSLELVLKKVKSENVPVIFTIFSPLTLANKISNNKVAEHIAQGHGTEVKNALAVITQTTADLARRAIAMGADGVFFASQLSSYDKVSGSLYAEYGKPYDLQVLRAAQDGWFNTLHAHGTNIMFELLKDYPVNVFNWHVGESLPTMAEAFDLTGKCLMGGLKRMDITNAHKNELYHQIYESMRVLGGRHLILTPGCVVRYPLDKDMLLFIKKAKVEVESALRERRYF
jgi:uroporphyrinogen decarboxylase